MTKPHTQICSACAEPSDILLPYGENLVCPTCSTLYEEPTIVLGSPLINHMGRRYEETFRRKVGNLLDNLGVEKLQDIGIVVVLITFSQNSPQLNMYSPKGELIFVFSENKQLREREEKVFEHVIIHETLHAYVSSKLKLGISQDLVGSFTFIEGSVGSLAEDIQLDKIAVNSNLKPYIRDEIRRNEILYKGLPVLSSFQWNSLPGTMKFNSMASVIRSYAQLLWLKKIVQVSHTKKQVKKNLRLVQSHYNK